MKIARRKKEVTRPRRATVDIEELNALRAGERAWCRHEKTVWQGCKVLSVDGLNVRVDPDDGPARTVDLHVEEVFP